jgi:hypothetical protein
MAKHRKPSPGSLHPTDKAAAQKSLKNAVHCPHGRMCTCGKDTAPHSGGTRTRPINSRQDKGMTGFGSRGFKLFRD